MLQILITIAQNDGPGQRMLWSVERVWCECGCGCLTPNTLMDQDDCPDEAAGVGLALASVRTMLARGELPCTSAS